MELKHGTALSIGTINRRKNNSHHEVAETRFSYWPNKMRGTVSLRGGDRN